MSVSVTMEVATITVTTQMEVAPVPVMMATSLTVMDTHVKVPYLLKLEMVTEYCVSLGKS